MDDIKSMHDTLRTIQYAKKAMAVEESYESLNQSAMSALNNHLSHLNEHHNVMVRAYEKRITDLESEIHALRANLSSEQDARNYLEQIVSKIGEAVNHTTNSLRKQTNE